MKIGKLDVINWVLGMSLTNLGVCFSTRSGFGLSMIGAVPYVLYVRISRVLPWFTQGTAEYFLEATLLAVTCLICRRFKPRFLLSFVTAVIAGFLIDGGFLLVGGNSVYELLPARVGALALGELLTALGLAFIFRSNMPKQVYELTVVELSDRFSADLNKVKRIFDYSMLLLAVLLSLVLTGKLTGIGVGTVFITAVNASLITAFGRLVDKVEKKSAES